jgi:hypothetical protein
MAERCARLAVSGLLSAEFQCVSMNVLPSKTINSAANRRISSRIRSLGFRQEVNAWLEGVHDWQFPDYCQLISSVSQ